MSTDKPAINIVWLKRDLRLQDHEGLQRAYERGLPILLLFAFEPSLLEDKHYDARHWNFIKESIVDLNSQLQPYNTRVLTVRSEVIPTFRVLSQFWKIRTIFSHQETGLKITYDRDKQFARFCKNNLISWEEHVNNGVFRGLQHRTTWREDWDGYMKQPQWKTPIESCIFITIEEQSRLTSLFESLSLDTPTTAPFQKGGTHWGRKYLHSFLKERYPDYNRFISKPTLSRKSCSRLSPYLAWGNLSVREVWQAAKDQRKIAAHKRALDGFTSRLRWQAHFIQKFEMEDTMEFYSINKGYHKLKKPIAQEYQDAWKEGKTGYPLVDACMRCLKETGYINFRMRALVVSFFTHNLWQPWQEASATLSQWFLDFEPGIHFPQLQMQAGETGINQLRIYNPVKNSKEHDPDGTFIKKWIPELRELPPSFIHEPYLMTELDQRFNNFKLGVDYPKPIVDLARTRKRASDTLWDMRKDQRVKQESIRILKKHTLPNRTNFD